MIIDIHTHSEMIAIIKLMNISISSNNYLFGYFSWGKGLGFIYSPLACFFPLLDYGLLKVRTVFCVCFCLVGLVWFIILFKVYSLYNFQIDMLHLRSPGLIITGSLYHHFSCVWWKQLNLLSANVQYQYSNINCTHQAVYQVSRLIHSTYKWDHALFFFLCL